MKNLLKRISLFLIAITSMIALVGCFTEIDDVKTLEFVNLPQSTYYKVVNTPTNLNAVETAYQALLGEITIRITDSTGTRTFTLKEAMERTDDYKVTINFDASILTTVGTKTIVITLGSSKLTYVFNVVEEQLFARGDGTAASPYEIETPQQFLNIGTRFFGIPVPQTNDETAETAWKYYYQFSFPYLAGGKHFKIVNDLDFTGVSFTPIGAFGGENYVPFTGTLTGKQSADENIVISNLKVTARGYSSSLFAGASGATFKNIDFTNVDIQGSQKLTGTLWSQRGILSVEHINYVENINVLSGFISGPRAGGLAGEASNTIFNNCTVGTLDDKTALFIVNTDGSYGGGLFSFSTTRSYGYKERKDITADKSGYITEDIFKSKSEIEELSDELTGYIRNEATNGMYKATNEWLTAAYKDVVYNCHVYATISASSGDKYSGGGIENSSIVYCNSDEVEAEGDLFKFDKSKYNYLAILTTEMDENEYDSVEYLFTFNAKSGTSLSDVPTFKISNKPNSIGGSINLNEEEIIEYDYDEDGNQIKEYKPEVLIDNKYAYITYVYYDAQGKIINLYRFRLNEDYNKSFNSATRVFEYSKKN